MEGIIEGVFAGALIIVVMGVLAIYDLLVDILEELKKLNKGTP